MLIDCAHLYMKEGGATICTGTINFITLLTWSDPLKTLFLHAGSTNTIRLNVHTRIAADGRLFAVLTTSFRGLI